MKLVGFFLNSFFIYKRELRLIYLCGVINVARGFPRGIVGHQYYDEGQSTGSPTKPPIWSANGLQLNRPGSLMWPTPIPCAPPQITLSLRSPEKPSVVSKQVESEESDDDPPPPKSAKKSRAKKRK